MTTADSQTTPSRNPWNLVVPLVCGLLVCVLFGLHVKHYYFLGDDCFISFRYAQNLVEGHGLVYNPGERVEGYTNFLWVLFMAGVMKLGLSPELVSNILGISSGLAILAAVVWLGAKSSSWHDPLIWIAPLCLAVNRTFGAWSTSGLETQFFSLLVLLAMLRLHWERKRGDKWPVVSSLLFAAATLTRPDGALYFTVAACFFGGEAVLLRRRRIAALAVWLVPYVVIVGTHVAWRYSYYGYLVPNTFYVKVSGLWWEQSSVWLWQFVREYQVLVLAPLVIAALVLRRDFLTLLFCGILAAHTAYMIYIGGDRFEFRFMNAILPYFYWLVQEGIRGLVHWARTKKLNPLTSLAGGLVLGLVAIGLSFRANTVKPVRGHQNYGIARLEYMNVYTVRRMMQGKFLRDLVDKGYLTGKELLAVGGAGALPYYSRFPTLDFRGLNDVHVAHQEVTERGWIAHEKVASLDYLRQRGVVIYDVCNMIVLFEEIPEELLPNPPDDPMWESKRPIPQWIEQLRSSDPGPRTWNRDFYEGPIRCVEAEGHFLVFATTLTEPEFRKTFSRFRIVF